MPEQFKYEMECDDCGEGFPSNDEHEDCPKCGSEYTFVCKAFASREEE